jgi:hypothetical protein
MSKVLWVEDQVENDLVDLFSRAIAAGHQVTYRPDVTSALALIRKQEYHVVIVDIRLMPGNDRRWSEYFYDRCTGSASFARLGLEMLRSIWHKNPAVPIPEEQRPKWLTPRMTGVLSVELEEEVRADLDDLGIDIGHFKRKCDPGDQAGTLSDLIAKIESGLPKG